MSNLKDGIRRYNLNMNVDIKKVKNIREELESLEEDDVLFIEEEGVSKYVVMPIEDYEDYEQIMNLFNDNSNKPLIKVAGPKDIDITYEQYEDIKKQIMDAVDQAFKPNPEKLN